MRIGFITGSLARIGSGATTAVPLARAFSQSGCTVYGLETTRLKRSQAIIEGLDVHFEPVAPYLTSRYMQVMNPWSRSSTNGTQPAGVHPQRKLDLAVGDALLALGSRLDVDIVYALHNTNVARLLRDWPHPSRLLVINLIGFGIDPSRGGTANTFPLQEMIFGHPYWDLHIAATKFEYEQYLQVYQLLGIDPAKLMYLPHSYREELFRPAPGEERGRYRGASRESATILYPVNVYPRKNIELAIDAISMLKDEIDCKLVVTGSIWNQDYYARLIQHAQDQRVADRVEFLGGVPVQRLIELYRLADVTVYTSHQETFGLGIVESLGCGTPVVGPDWIIPCREILEGAPGCWHASKDAETFARAISQALRADHNREHLAAYARAQYGNSVIARKFLDACRTIKADKDRYEKALASINWKGLYRDAGDLL